jgi:hypothetical protein
MKKIFTMILFAAGTISFTSAQSHPDKSIAWNDNKKINNHKHSDFNKGNVVPYGDSYFSQKEKREKLLMINREFDQKIASVKYNRHLSGREKARQIQWLQGQRRDAINKVEFQYAKSKSFGHDWHKW